MHLVSLWEMKGMYLRENINISFLFRLVWLQHFKVRAVCSRNYSRLFHNAQFGMGWEDGGNQGNWTANENWPGFCARSNSSAGKRSDTGSPQWLIDCRSRYRRAPSQMSLLIVISDTSSSCPSFLGPAAPFGRNDWREGLAQQVGSWQVFRNSFAPYLLVPRV